VGHDETRAFVDWLLQQAHQRNRGAQTARGRPRTKKAAPP
jgi:hypothetical protein